jgi:uncharacterized protein YsxB (DUF464 family)
MATHVVLETLGPSSAISNYRASGHSNVGHHDINAVPFGVSVLVSRIDRLRTSRRCQKGDPRADGVGLPC